VALKAKAGIVHSVHGKMCGLQIKLCGPSTTGAVPNAMRLRQKEVIYPCPYVFFTFTLSVCRTTTITAATHESPGELRDPACGFDSFGQFLRTILLVSTNVTSALEVFLK